MMTKQMTKLSMDDLPRCSSTLPPRGENVGGRGQGTRLYFLFLKPHTNERNIVGQQLPTSLDATLCCVRLHILLHVVAQSLKPVKLLGTCKRTQQLPQVADSQTDLHTFNWQKLTAFSFGDHFNNFQNLFFWLCIDFIRKKLMLVIPENWRIKGEKNLTVPAESHPLRKAGSSASLSRLEYLLFQTF